MINIYIVQRQIPYGYDEWRFYIEEDNDEELWLEYYINEQIQARHTRNISEARQAWLNLLNKGYERIQ
tara:strand:+ start:17475 stop:17678 length:204 start_codon:yes stop_codon:yes gene_type:complete